MFQQYCLYTKFKFLVYKYKRFDVNKPISKNKIRRQDKNHFNFHKIS